METLKERLPAGAVEDLSAFCAVIEFGSVSAAARRLGESKGGVSRRLSRLEARLGVALLARTSRAVSATEEGQAFFAKAREALGLLEDAFAGARDARELPRGLLRITAPVDLSVELLPELIVRFREQHPQITLELLATDQALDLAAHRIDLALRAASDGPLPDTGYRASQLARFAVRLYAAPGYLARRGTPPSVDALPEHDLLAFRDPGAQLELSDRNGRRQRLPWASVLRSTDFASLLRLTRAGGGIAPLPEPVAQPAVRLGQLVPVLPDWQSAQAALYAVSLGGREAPARVRVFREFLRAALEAERCTAQRAAP
jgi:DNA-binding transcriptional LysR family regulator